MSGSYHDHDHDGAGHSHAGSWWKYALFTGVVGLLLAANYAGLFTTLFGLNAALLLALVAGYRVVYQAILDLFDRKLSADLAVAVAAAAAVAVGEYFAAAEVMFIMLVGEGLEHYTVERARQAISGFVQMTPPFARVRRAGAEVEIPPGEVAVGEVVIVRAGERVPVDGVVVAGASSVDERAITGEPMPASKAPGDPVYGGSVNEYGLLEARAERVGDQTAIERIRHLIAEAQRQRAPIERTADRLARYFLPAVLVAGGAIYYFTGQTLRAVAALIVACPCALVLATPAAVAAAIARLARAGVLVKGGGIVEELSRIGVVAFDKTGTLTAGRPVVETVTPAPGFGADEVVALAAAAEQHSEHLLGREIVAEARRRELVAEPAEGFRIRPGMGVQAEVAGRTVRVGNLALVREGFEGDLGALEATMAEHAIGGGTAVAVTLSGRPAGVIGLRDPLRPEARAAVLGLRAAGIERVALVTGDEQAAAGHVARQLGITEVHARLLPEDKARVVRELRAAGARVLMVGDGINDSLSLATADVGLAMGRGAADLSAQAAHVVFLKDRLDQIPDLVEFARRVVRRIRASILIFAFGVNAGALLASGFGYLSPPMAAVVHQGASLLVILNCVRLLVEGKAVAAAGPGPAPRWRRWVDRMRPALAPGHLVAWLRRRAGLLARAGGAALGLGWLVSGLALIGPDQIGVVQRFGRYVGPDLGPGLHLRWPRPIESVTRLTPRRVEVVEVGYRTVTAPGESGPEPSVYEWNTQHRLGRYRKVPEEALMLTGDENLVEVNAAVQYRILDPRRFLFRVQDPPALLRAVAERTLRAAIAREALDGVLTTRRGRIELGWKEALAGVLGQYGSGVEVLDVRLQDVHPPLEVVEAFRDVATALEEKSTRINEAEGYRLEQVPLARGQEQARILGARAYSEARIERAAGEGLRFGLRQEAYRRNAPVTALRLYFEAIEQVLPNKPKTIADAKKLGRRRFLVLDAKDLNLLNVVDPRPGTPEPPAK